MSTSKLEAMGDNVATVVANEPNPHAPSAGRDNACSIDDGMALNFDASDLELLEALNFIATDSIGSARGRGSLTNANSHSIVDPEIEHNLVGQSARMREVYRFISKVAPTDTTVLLYGESGTGKELAARAIHQNSPRVNKPFVAINCAALVETLLESELFGHEKGAFTGAVAQKKGKLEMADGGTVFLDELGELAPTLQAKLLRVLEEREFERLGSTRSIRVDIRLIGATNKNLKEAMEEGSFRNDLYYRLNVVSFELPPLRERRDDILLLADHFAAKCSHKSNRKLSGISPAARAHLMDYNWPGNVRELENVIERAIVLGSSDMILQEDLPQIVVEAESYDGAPTTKFSDAVKESKKHLILKAIEQANGIYTEAAKLLGVHPNHLHRLVRTMNLRPALKK
ncbi:MAG TPA: sigma 54-interacting transcriptional regulator [Pyrinomonadaceae bacterium]|nr:sigma 54-interacting transcriptional regulator [Pyrinomonadaceae bacterium]